MQGLCEGEITVSMHLSMHKLTPFLHFFIRKRKSFKRKELSEQKVAS